MSSKRTFDVEESSSGLKNSEEPNSKVRLNRQVKKTVNDLNLSKKKKKLSKNSVFTSTCNGTMLKICAVNPNKSSSFDNEDYTQICRTSNDSQSTKQNSPIDDSVKNGKIEQMFEISSSSNISTINDIILPKNKKVLSKKILCHSTPKEIKRQIFDVNSNLKRLVVHEEATQEFISPMEDLKKIEDIKQSIHYTSESSEILTTNDLSSPLQTKVVSKKRVPRSTFKERNKKISNVNIKTSELTTITSKSSLENIVHKEDTQGFISPLEDCEQNEDHKQSIQNTSESCDVLTTNDLSLPLPTKVASKKKVLKKRGSHSTFKGKNKKMSDVNIENLSELTTNTPKSNAENFVHKEDTQGFISSLEDCEENEDRKQSIQDTSESCDILTTNDLSLPCPTKVTSKKKVLKKRGSHSTFKGKNKKMSDVNIENLSELTANTPQSNSENFVHKEDTQGFISPLEDCENIKDPKQSIQATVEESCEILTTNNLSLPLPTKVVSEKRVSRSIFKRKNQKIPNVNINTLSESTTNTPKSNSENIYNEDTQGFRSPLEDCEKNEDRKQSIQDTSESCDILTTNDLSLHCPTKVTSKKKVLKTRGSRSTSRGKNKKMSNVNIETLSELTSNTPLLNSENVNFNEMQPIVMVEALSDSLVKTLSKKRLNTVDENFDLDKKISGITGQHSKPAETMLKAMDSEDSSRKIFLFHQHSKPAETMLKIKNSEVSSFKKSMLKKTTSRFGRRIKPTKFVDHVEGSSIPKHSKLSAKHSVSSEEDYDENSEINDLLIGTHEINDTISNLKTTETTKSLVASSQPVKYCASEKLQVNSIERNNNISAVLNDPVNNYSSPNIDCVEVDTDKTMIHLLQAEVYLLDYVQQLRSALRLSHANYEMALDSLQKLLKLNINAVMLKRNRDVIDTITKVTKYIGNVSEWNMSEQETLEHNQKASEIRDKAELVLILFKSFFTVPDGKLFQEVFDKEVEDFMLKTKDMTCS